MGHATQPWVSLSSQTMSCRTTGDLSTALSQGCTRKRDNTHGDLRLGFSRFELPLHKPFGLLQTLQYHLIQSQERWLRARCRLDQHDPIVRQANRLCRGHTSLQDGRMNKKKLCICSFELMLQLFCRKYGVRSARIQHAGRDVMVRSNVLERHTSGNERKRVRYGGANPVYAKAYNGVIVVIWREYRG